jgi:hypothetical protein
LKSWMHRCHNSDMQAGIYSSILAWMQASEHSYTSMPRLPDKHLGIKGTICLGSSITGFCVRINR